MVIPALLGRTVAGEPRTRPGPVMAKARRLAHELEERRALVGLVRVRPAEGVLSPPAQGTREALASADVGAFPWQAAFLGKIEPRAARPGRFLPRE